MSNKQNYIIGYNYRLPTIFEEKRVSQVENTSFRSGKLTLDTDSPFFPVRGDLKIMREDIVATIIAIKELFESLQYSQTVIENLPLFVANGAFVDQPEKHLNRFPIIYATFTPDMTHEQKWEKVYRMSPPLLALETLTNSSMSFIAQYTGMKSQNTTFGNTSSAAFHAISQGFVQLNLNPNQPVMICAANCGDTYSYLTNSGVIGHEKDWKESAAVVNLVLQQSDEIPENATCKITCLKSSTTIPDLENQLIIRTWDQLLPDQKADLILFSGAFSAQDHELDALFISKLNRNTYSLFSEFGNMGAANIAMGIAKGIELFSSEIAIIDLLDRDVYGRESLIRIEKC